MAEELDLIRKCPTQSLKLYKHGCLRERRADFFFLFFFFFGQRIGFSNDKKSLDRRTMPVNSLNLGTTCHHQWAVLFRMKSLLKSEIRDLTVKLSTGLRKEAIEIAFCLIFRLGNIASLCDSLQI